MLNVIIQASDRTPGDGTDCNYYSTAQHRHKSPGPNVSDNTAYAELGESQVILCHAIITA